MRLIALVCALSLLLAPLPAESQPAGKVYRIGVLETRNAALNAANLDALRQGLRELGYRDGQNVEIAYRSSDGRNERFPALASELVTLKVDLILTRGTPAALAARNATQTIPVVMASSGDPVGAGLVASLGRPGGNVTGLSNYNVEIYAKRVELLKELLPKLTRIAGLFNMGNPVLPIQWSVAERAARSLGVQPQLLDVRRPEELARAFDTAAKEHAEVMVVALDGLTQANLQLDRRARREAQAAVDFRDQGVRGRRRTAQLRSERSSPLSASGHVRRSDPQGCETGRPSGRAAHEVRAGDQPQGRPGARPLDSAVAPVPCGARDRLGAPDVRSSRT
jgi:ABC-type uncharacterized transport system substrate-binding protein